MTSRGPRLPRALAWPAAIGIAYVVAFVLVYVVTVRTERGRVVSDAALRGAISSGVGVQDTVDAILNVVSVASLLGAVAVVAFIALLRLDRLRGLASVGVLVLTNVSTWVLKEHLISRPDLGLDEVAPATLNSLPGGHATAAFSAVAALLIVVPRPMRTPTAALGAGLATATAMATMFAGWHRPGDSVAAFLLVGAFAMAAVAVVIVVDDREPWPGASAPQAAALRWWLAPSVGALLLGGVLSAGLSVADPVRDTTPGALTALVSAGLVIVGAVLAVLAGMLRGLEAMEAAVDGDREHP